MAVVERLSIPLIPNTRFKTKFTRLPKGSRWQSWAAFGIYVDNSLVIQDEEVTENRQGEGEPSRCKATEDATLTCPFYLYPLVKWQFNKSHVENHMKLKQYFASQSASTGRYQEGILRLP
jgi:hypothetical protein